jgi:hypothetical protein
MLMSTPCCPGHCLLHHLQMLWICPTGSWDILSSLNVCSEYTALHSIHHNCDVMYQNVQCVYVIVECFFCV